MKILSVDVGGAGSTGGAAVIAEPRALPVGAARADDESYELPCRYGYCQEVYDRATRRAWGGFGPVGCPHEQRGGLRGHGTWAEQFAPRAARKPPLRRRGWRRR